MAGASPPCVPVYGLISLMTIDLRFFGLDHHVNNCGLDHHVKKSKRGACKHKAATVRRTTT